ncbi:HYR domain-containing protein [Aquimarina agarilytica]|uniref:HYR domain-containing protein n=1 Tax=Aquimarina agarilytica TaxID=1087449 RepID=UPI0004926463|nr:HYR domain-containing protein [Aquimarina agarilytica]
MKTHTKFMFLKRGFLKSFLLVMGLTLVVACTKEDEDIEVPKVESQQEVFFNFIGKTSKSSARVAAFTGGEWLSVLNNSVEYLYLDDGTSSVANKNASGRTLCVYDVIFVDTDYAYLNPATTNGCAGQIIALPIKTPGKVSFAKRFDAIKGELVPWKPLRYNNGTTNDPCSSDTVAPEIKCGISGARVLSSGSALPDYRSSFSATDNCTERLTLSQSPAARSSVRSGNQVITITAKDAAGNTSKCSFTVIGNGCSGSIATPKLTKEDRNGGFMVFVSVQTTAVADEYEWTFSGSGNIGTFTAGPNGQGLDQRKVVRSKENSILVVPDFGNTPSRPQRASGSISLRVRQGGCWSKSTLLSI